MFFFVWVFVFGGGVTSASVDVIVCVCVWGGGDCFKFVSHHHYLLMSLVRMEFQKSREVHITLLHLG